MNLEEHLKRQIAFSRATFGPGQRQEGVIDHIKKELNEIVEGDNDPNEWVDVVILALDGLWRSIHYGHKGEEPDLSSDVIYNSDYLEVYQNINLSDWISKMIVKLILEKQNKNELRDWPDWRTADPNKAIEHDRTGENNA